MGKGGGRGHMKDWREEKERRTWCNHILIKILKIKTTIFQNLSKCLLLVFIRVRQAAALGDEKT